MRTRRARKEKVATVAPVATVQRVIPPAPRWIPLDGKGKPCDPRNATGYAIDPRDRPVHK
jgi:hypothetical protein